MRPVKAIPFIIGAFVAFTVGYGAYRIYPRHVAIVVRGVQYEVGHRPHPHIVMVAFIGTLHRSLLAGQTFDGRLTVRGATVLDRGNGRPITIVLHGGSGGPIV